MSWEILYGLAAIILIGALYYGVRMNKTRNRANDKVREAAVRASYKEGDDYDPKQFEKQLKP